MVLSLLRMLHEQAASALEARKCCSLESRRRQCWQHRQAGRMAGKAGSGRFSVAVCVSRAAQPQSQS
jgi:hypothetical protein